MPVNPANFNVGPQALRRLQEKRRWHQFNLDQGSPLAVAYPTGLGTQLVRRPRSIGTRVSYKLFVSPVANPAPPVVTAPSVTLTAPPTRHQYRSRLAAPTVVNQPGFLANPPLVSLTYPPQRKQNRSRLVPPGVVNPAAQPPVETKIHASLAVFKHATRGTISALGAPTVVGPFVAPPVVTTLRTRLAPSRRPTRFYFLRQPLLVTVPAPVVTTLRVSLVDFKRIMRGTISVLGSPTIVGPFVAPAPPVVTVPSVTLAPHRQPAHFYILRPPAVTPPVAVPPVVTTLRLRLAPSRRPTLFHVLRPPTVIDPAAPPTPPSPQQTNNFGAFLDRGGMYERDHGKRRFYERYARRS